MNSSAVSSSMTQACPSVAIASKTQSKPLKAHLSSFCAGATDDVIWTRLNIGPQAVQRRHRALHCGAGQWMARRFTGDDVSSILNQPRVTQNATCLLLHQKSFSRRLADMRRQVRALPPLPEYPQMESDEAYKSEVLCTQKPETKISFLLHDDSSPWKPICTAQAALCLVGSAVAVRGVDTHNGMLAAGGAALAVLGGATAALVMRLRWQQLSHTPSL